MLVKMNGQVCRVLRMEDHGPDTVKVSVVTGSRTIKANAGRRPGPKWRPSPCGSKRKWVTYKEVIEDGIIVKTGDILGEEWPVGFEDFGMPIERLMEIVRPVVKRAMDVGGVRARRICPELSRESVNIPLKRAGLPVPNDEEFKTVVQSAWEDLKPKRRQPSPASGRMIIPPKPKKPGVAPAGVELADDERWSDSLNMAVTKGQDGDLLEKAVAKGWPFAMTDGAKARRRGTAGYTLSFMAKNKYTEDRFGSPESHGLGESDDTEPDEAEEMPQEAAPADEAPAEEPKEEVTYAKSTPPEVKMPKPSIVVGEDPE